MTIKEIASFTGKDERTIQRWVENAKNKTTSDKMSSISDKMSLSSPLYPSDFTLNEVEEILRAGSLSDDAVSILMDNARKNESGSLNDELSKNNYISETLARTMEEMTKAFNSLAKSFEIVVSKNRQALNEQYKAIPSTSNNINKNPITHVLAFAKQSYFGTLNGLDIPRISAFNDYKNWCLKNNIIPLGKKNFYSEIRKIDGVLENTLSSYRTFTFNF